MPNSKNKKVISSITLLLSILFLMVGYHLTTEFIGNKKYNLENHIVAKELKPAFDSNNIAIAFASDNNYVKYLSVAIVSLTDNMSKDYNYDIVILEDKIKDKSKRLLLKQIKDFKNVSLRFIDINKYFDEHKDVEFYTNGNYTRSIYNRLFIPNIFRNYKKVLYLDCDILISFDLVDLYNKDLGDNLIGAVSDFGTKTWLPDEINPKDDFYNYVQKTVGINNPGEYINSGVIVFNVKKCLKDNFFQLCLNALEEIGNPDFPDQDIISKACNGRIKYLDYRYNFLAYSDTIQEVKDYIPDSILNDIKILHFAVYHPLNNGLYSESIGKWIKTSFRSPFFNNKNLTMFKVKLTLMRYKICYRIYNKSKERSTKYREKIKNAKKRVEFLESMD